MPVEISSHKHAKDDFTASPFSRSTKRFELQEIDGVDINAKILLRECEAKKVDINIHVSGSHLSQAPYRHFKIMMWEFETFTHKNRERRPQGLTLSTRYYLSHFDIYSGKNV